MNRRERLQERYEDALFALLMDDIAAMEEKEAEEENGRLNNDPSAAVPEDLDRRCLQTIRRGFVRQKAYTVRRFTLKAMKGAVMAAGIGALLFTGAFATSEGVRVNTIHLVVEVFEGGRTFHFDDPIQESAAPVETVPAPEVEPSEDHGNDPIGVQTQEPEGEAVVPSAPPAAFDAGDFQVTDGVLTKYTGPGGDVVIPGWVTAIGNSAFWRCKSLTSVTIPDSVTEIGGYAFSECTRLVAVTIPDSVTRIGYGTFSSCRSLTDVTISAGVTSIGDYAFSCCTSLTSLTIPDSVTSIGENAFSSCNSLTSVTIPGSVTSIGKSAFWNCDNLKVVTISDGVTRIGNSAFRGCGSLTAVTIPGSVTSIGDWAFADCANLTDLTIPEGVTSIGDYAFSRCRGLTAMTLPDSVTVIGDGAFFYCSGLTGVNIPAGVSRIGEYTFWGCSGLTGGVTIPDGVTYIGKAAFGECTGLTSVSIPARTAIIGESICPAPTVIRGVEGSYAQLWAMDNGYVFVTNLSPAATPGMTASAVVERESVHAGLLLYGGVGIGEHSSGFYDDEGLHVEPLLYNGTTYIPLRTAAMWLAADPVWDRESMTVVLTSNGKEPDFYNHARWPDDREWWEQYDRDLRDGVTAELCRDLTVMVDGQAETFVNALGEPVYPLVFRDNVYLPLRDVARLCGLDVLWYQIPREEHNVDEIILLPFTAETYAAEVRSYLDQIDSFDSRIQARMEELEAIWNPDFKTIEAVLKDIRRLVSRMRDLPVPGNGNPLASGMDSVSDRCGSMLKEWLGLMDYKLTDNPDNWSGKEMRDYFLERLTYYRDSLHDRLEICELGYAALAAWEESRAQ